MLLIITINGWIIHKCTIPVYRMAKSLWHLQATGSCVEYAAFNCWASRSRTYSWRQFRKLNFQKLCDCDKLKFARLFTLRQCRSAPSMTRFPLAIMFMEAWRSFINIYSTANIKKKSFKYGASNWRQTPRLRWYRLILKPWSVALKYDFNCFL